MGAYLSEPIVEKCSSDEANDFIEVGASSMQGWRISQEDAHNCILKFDENTSFFAVYDGHGGAEVATYCADKLPDFLKNLKSYKDGDFEQALKDAFLGFDETLLQEDVIEILKKLADEKNSDKDSDMCEDEEEEDLAELCQEGLLPLDQVLEKYKGCAGTPALKFPHINKLKQDEAGGSGSKPLSPYLRGRRCLNPVDDETSAKQSNADAPSCSSSSASTSISPAKKTPGKEQSTETKEQSRQKSKDIEGEDSIVSSSSGKIDHTNKENFEDKLNEPSSTEANGSSSLVSSSPDSSSVNAKNSIQQCISGSSKTKVQNGDVTSYQEDKISTNTKMKNEKVTSSSISSSVFASPLPSTMNSKQENGEVSSLSSSSFQSPSKSGTARTSSSITSSTLTAPAVKNIINMPTVDDDDDSSSEDDVDFQAAEDDENSSTEDGDEDCDACDETEEDNEDDEETEDDEEGLSDDVSAFCTNMIEESGKDSGCTAVIAILHGRDLYVANAGDSRCVVSRNGKAIEMSLDHKPEDEEECSRIFKAGGKVTLDGRVNGGLNLSRAIGDHAYKMNKDLPPEKQMISALPDVRKLIISPEDEFMVLACDGVWNFMSSDEVVEFVRKRFEKGIEKVSQICEELFDNCLAPNTLGDGTGCDNMTAVIIRFKPKILELPTRISIESEAIAVPLEVTAQSKKRAASPSPNQCDGSVDNDDDVENGTSAEEQKPTVKRQKTDNDDSNSTTTTNTVTPGKPNKKVLAACDEDDPMSTTSSSSSSSSSTTTTSTGASTNLQQQSTTTPSTTTS